MTTSVNTLTNTGNFSQFTNADNTRTNFQTAVSADRFGCASLDGKVIYYVPTITNTNVQILYSSDAGKTFNSVNFDPIFITYLCSISCSESGQRFVWTSVDINGFGPCIAWANGLPIVSVSVNRWSDIIFGSSSAISSISANGNYILLTRGFDTGFLVPFATISNRSTWTLIAFSGFPTIGIGHSPQLDDNQQWIAMRRRSNAANFSFAFYNRSGNTYTLKTTPSFLSPITGLCGAVDRTGQHQVVARTSTRTIYWTHDQWFTFQQMTVSYFPYWIQMCPNDPRYIFVMTTTGLIGWVFNYQFQTILYTRTITPPATIDTYVGFNRILFPSRTHYMYITNNRRMLPSGPPLMIKDANNISMFTVDDRSNVILFGGSSFDPASDSTVRMAGPGSSTKALCGSWLTYSSLRLKTNVRDMSRKEVVDQIQQLVPKYYRWIEEFTNSSSVSIGLIAEEVEGTVPSIVQKHSLGIEYSRLIALIVGYIQELYAVLDETEAEFRKDYDKLCLEIAELEQNSSV